MNSAHSFGPPSLSSRARDCEFLADGKIFVTPGGHLRENRQQFDALFGQRINSLLLVREVVDAGDDPLIEQLFQPIGENVGGDAFLQDFVAQFAKMPPVAEHHVADDEQAPSVAEHFQREIDGAAERPVSVMVVSRRGRGALEKLLAILHWLSQDTTGCKLQSVLRAVAILR